LALTGVEMIIERENLSHHTTLTGCSARTALQRHIPWRILVLGRRPATTGTLIWLDSAAFFGLGRFGGLDII
jgi:hypothetical protein